MKFSGLWFAMAIASLSLAACGGGGKATAVSPPPPSTANEWTWVNGANVVSQLGTYGTQGTPAPTNVPGARFMTATWTDASGNFWLFAGNGGAGAFNDVWKYSEGAWTWVSGSNAPNELGIYGTPGVSAPGNVPGARSAPVTWTDASGNFWFFGGCGYDAVGAYGYLSDLWSYSAGNMDVGRRTEYGRPTGKLRDRREHPPPAIFHRPDAMLPAGPTPPEIFGFSVD